LRQYARTASVRLQTSDSLRMCRALFWWCRCVRVESCCCGFSLEQGSLAISVVSFLFGIVGIVAFGITFNSGPNYIPLGYGIVQIVSSIWLYGAVKQLSPGGLAVWLVACMLAIIIIALDVCVNTLRIVNYGEANTINGARKSELLVELGVVLLIAALLTAVTIYFWIVVYSFFKDLTDGGGFWKNRSGREIKV